VEQAAKILDCIQICAPRAAQAALPWAIDGLRDWREAKRAEINRRAQVFRRALAPLPEWRIESAGAYFAYLRHPFPGATAQAVAERLATERGVLCLPGSYFGPGQEGHLRVAFANVGAEVLAGLTERLRGVTV
jgi:aspartate/methionine/tyrosine aminotransferase